MGTLGVLFEPSPALQEQVEKKVEGVKRKEIYKDGDYHDIVMLAVFRDDWLPLWHAYQGLGRKSADGGQKRGAWVSVID